MENVEPSVIDFTNPVGFQVAYLNQHPHERQQEVLLSSNKHKVIV